MAKAVWVIEVEGRIAWRARSSEDGRAWIGECEALNMALEAQGLDELHSLIAEAMHLLLTDLLADDELDDFLRERGWSMKRGGDGAFAAGSDIDDVEFHVPFELIAGSRLGSERRPH